MERNSEMMIAWREVLRGLRDYEVQTLHALLRHAPGDSCLPPVLCDILHEEIIKRGGLPPLYVGAFIYATAAESFSAVKQREGIPFPDFVWAAVESEGIFFGETKVEIWEQNL